MKILIFEEIMIAELIALRVEVDVKVQFFKSQRLASILDFLKEHPDMDFAFISDRLESQSGAEIFHYMKDNNLQTKFILSTHDRQEFLPDFKKLTVDANLERPHIVAALDNIINEMIIPAAGEDLLSEDSHYGKVHFQNFTPNNILAQDLFIKLSENKYVKVMKKGDPFSQADLDHYDAKDLNYFYIKKTEIMNFIEKFSKDLEKKQQRIQELPRLEMTEKLHETVHEVANILGFSKHIRKIANECIEQAIEDIQSKPQFIELFAEIAAHKENYIHSHSIILAHVACSLAAQMGWDQKAILYKLAMAAFLHDICIDSHDLASVNTLEELYNSERNFTEKDMEQLKNHPENAAKLVRLFGDIPLDVDTIILQHHERPDGTGFPHKLDFTRISSLSALFNIAHEVVHFLIKRKPEEGFDDFLLENIALYSKGQYIEICSFIQDAFAEHKRKLDEANKEIQENDKGTESKETLPKTETTTETKLDESNTEIASNNNESEALINNLEKTENIENNNTEADTVEDK